MRNESGRSMVEMLGVLAIIGVLSVGGIAGYTMAMRKYQANEAMAAAAQCAMEARAGNMGEGIDSCPGVDFTKISGVTSGGVVSGHAKDGQVTITFIDNNICLAANAIKTASTACSGGTGTWTFS